MAASLILAAFQTSVEEDEGSHRLDLSAGEQRPRSAHVYGGRRKERKCEAEASRPHGGFGREGGGAVCSDALLHGGDLFRNRTRSEELWKGF